MANDDLDDRTVRGRRTIPPPGFEAQDEPDDPGRTTQAVYYRDATKHEPVDEFIEALKSAGAQEEIDAKTDLLNGLPEDAPPLAFPYSSQVRGELRELRCHFGRTHYRILYRRSQNLFVLLHAIEKRSAKVPEADIKIANDRFDDFKARMDAQRRVPPRAAGRDAPNTRRDT